VPNCKIFLFLLLKVNENDNNNNNNYFAPCHKTCPGIRELIGSN
jgi:hypothetical protein